MFAAATDKASIIEQARLSTERYAAHQPLSVFDGVPVAFKDMITIKVREVPKPGVANQTRCHIIGSGFVGVVYSTTRSVCVHGYLCVHVHVRVRACITITMRFA